MLSLLCIIMISTFLKRCTTYMKEIDVKNWNRRAHYELFGSYQQPCFRVDVRLDMTKFMKNKRKQDGFFLPFVYLLTKAVNETFGLRLRLKDGGVVDVEKVGASFTVMLSDNNFAFCQAEWTDNYDDFYKGAKNNIETVKRDALKGEGSCFETNNRLDLVYLSCLPWIDFLSISNPLPFGNELSMSIPRLNWGKCVKEGRKYKMTLSATINHALVDGLEISEFFIKLQNYLDNAKEYFK